MNCATIPRNTIITPTFVSDEWSRQVLLEYSNCKMLYTLLDNENNKKINLEEFTQEEIIETAQKEMGIYEYSYNNGKKIDTILEGETYQVSAKDPYRVFPEIEYISYNGKEGWIKLTDADNTTEDNDQNNIKVHKTNYLIIAIIACSVIIIVTVVTILLINKKNKNTKKEIN